MDKGYFKVHRKLFQNPIWQLKPYSKGQALIELIGAANHTSKVVVLGNKEVEIGRGQLHISEQKLAEKWGWSRKRVRTYLGQLERLNMVTTVCTSKGTTITIENYEIYQGEGTAEDTAEGTAKGTAQEQQKNSAGTAKELPSNYIKNVKNVKNVKNICLSPKSIGEFFEKIWALYPVKKGKGSVSDTQQKKLFAIGLEEMTRAIERYAKEQEGADKQFWKHGSTFFNSGYVDYLDANYQEGEQEEGTEKEDELYDYEKFFIN